MKIPASRLPELKIAYRLSTSDQVEFDQICALERLVEHTGLDREFGEAVLDISDALAELPPE